MGFKIICPVSRPESDPEPLFYIRRAFQFTTSSPPCVHTCGRESWWSQSPQWTGAPRIHPPPADESSPSPSTAPKSGIEVFYRTCLIQGNSPPPPTKQQIISVLRIRIRTILLDLDWHPGPTYPDMDPGPDLYPFQPIVKITTGTLLSINFAMLSKIMTPMLWEDKTASIALNKSKEFRFAKFCTTWGGDPDPNLDRHQMESRVRLQIRIGIKTMLIHNNGWFESKVAAIQFIEVAVLLSWIPGYNSYALVESYYPFAARKWGPESGTGYRQVWWTRPRNEDCGQTDLGI